MKKEDQPGREQNPRVAALPGEGAGMLPERLRWKRMAGGVLTTAGAVSLRFALIAVGKHAAGKPRAVMEPMTDRRP